MFTLDVAPCVASSVVVRLLAVTVPGLRRVRGSNRSKEGGVTTVAECIAINLTLVRSVTVTMKFKHRKLLRRCGFMGYTVIMYALATNDTFLV